MFKWLSKNWWGYLLQKPFSLKAFWCRKNGHKCGVWWVNTCGLEPDMRCKNCGDDLS